MPNKWKIFLVLIAIFGIASFSHAAKKSKWQKLLEKNSVPESYWQKYLPKVSRSEYRKAVKKYQGAQNDAYSGVSGEGVKIIEGKYPLPAESGKIAREQHLWLKKSQSASNHYSMTDTPSSCRNGMAGGYGAFGPLGKSDKEEEVYYVNMRWGYADWIEPESELNENVSKDEKSITLKSGDNFAKSGYVKIGNEYIRYSSKSGDKLKGLKRGYKSSKLSHEKNDSVKQEYRYKGGNWERITRALHLDSDKKNWFKKKKVLVTNEKNGKKVVASILEAGPAIWTNRVGGLSPEAFDAIDAKNNETCTFQYVDEHTKLGKVD
ncbi:MAG: hypothetical protein UX02_C0002G0236 [Candidatus Moranbacteria bacterium GW2011_GWC1_45_18]|nr:MAG: hypothetical protein UT79_C0001G0225 [Candidatus Moranbacteria bacterium GW2011_GWC2_40_12]KKT33384.1 MAG: hypothetical protein UW19_C0009G0030 [Candidatus Moranbacteria bacterium GW2011_GWF2_44_10]KKT99917.1 MAG: hypothetical protein UX02_C0002G0236 [Candidatus Moranbacteria bacterium GW2011_GWC1_45_18]OGI24045.1 MAG: hypothetical protein A2194_00800 [Candidatus Moranbacteria bacterium RIFOXYA1_FULL_44_8]OGI34582.1 MAG: hypothetical protein A2407_02365 [Candidatus Moranbacteria bacteri